MVRAYEPADLAAVMELWLAANLQAHWFIPPSYWQENYPLVERLIPQARVYVFCREGSPEILGFIGLEGGQVAGLFVREEARSRGIGKQLLDHAKGLGRPLTLHVYRKNPRALTFYLREGFTIQGRSVDPGTSQEELVLGWA